MRHFDRAELARRYHLYRPRVHAQVIHEIAASRPARNVNVALDVACGTGHSTEALATLARLACGCDLSAAMLSIARREASSAQFVRCEAESLPFPQGAFDLATVSLAFHWFDQRRFLAEAARVLAGDGELWVYNLYFPGVLLGDDIFFAWHRDRFLVRYPSPSRHSETLASLLDTKQFPLLFVEQRKLAYEVGFTATELRSYLTTSSNIDAALQAGALLRDVDGWLEDELAPFFRGSESQRFMYIGSADIAVAV
jgi:ubiquinone/menaquinone biosynthesis C-methylase UbiE